MCQCVCVRAECVWAVSRGIWGCHLRLHLLGVQGLGLAICQRMLHTLTELENNTHTHTHTGEHKMAKTFKSSEAAAQKGAQFRKSNTHPDSHVARGACTHADLSIFLLAPSLPRCNRINEPITGYRSSHGFKGIKAIILPPYCGEVCIFVHADMRLFMHGWDQ